VTGTVSPAHTGAPIYLDRYVSGKWTKYKTTKLAANTSTSSKYSFSLRLPRGRHTLRVRRPSDAQNVGARSSTLKLRVI
jgi:hypothetical protein